MAEVRQAGHRRSHRSREPSAIRLTSPLNDIPEPLLSSVTTSPTKVWTQSQQPLTRNGSKAKRRSAGLLSRSHSDNAIMSPDLRSGPNSRRTSGWAPFQYNRSANSSSHMDRSHRIASMLPNAEEIKLMKCKVVSFTISSILIDEAQKESLDAPNYMAVQPRMLASHLTSYRSKSPSLQPAPHRWRRLVSPLVGFLTYGKNLEWIQLAGHVGSFIPGRGGVICKKVGELEKKAYEKLMVQSEPLHTFVPFYNREVEMVSGQWYLELEDLLANFNNPSIMDVKMGTRTFLETEVSKSALRMDLLEKMLKVDPNEPTEDEKSHGITKLRYMQFREERSTSKNFGFRLEGIKLANEDAQTNFKTVDTLEKAIDAIESFLPPKGTELRTTVMSVLSDRLEDMFVAQRRSKFFMSHEIIGSSLLFLYDNSGEAGVWMIDFGKSEQLDHDLKHTSKWVLGNREDGYLIGMDNVMKIVHRDRI